MDIRQMEIFVAVAEAGSLHGAARRMYMSQPAISQSMRKLERTVGGELLVRSPQGVVLTAAGVAFLGHAREIVRSVGDALDEARRVARRRRLTIGVLAGHLGAGELTPLILGMYRRTHPEVEVSLVDLSFADQFQAVHRGQVDAAIVRSPERLGGFDYVPLFDEPRMLCFAESADVPAGDGDAARATALDLPVLNLFNTPDTWSSYWELSDLRRPSGRVHSPAVTISELQSSLSGSGGALSVAMSGWRLAISNPLLRAIPIEEASRSECQVIHLPGGSDGLAAEFAQLAHQVAGDNIDIVDGARLVA